ncbi:MAG: methyltransferase domain-containing protein [Defluviitaleaceae bacterium]|nr:methyltransferase domain-containing protein [Defluviitaleaceae bacterium]
MVNRRYYAGINFGLEPAAANIMRRSGAEIIEVTESAIIFTAPEQLAEHFECICTNIFLVFAQYDSVNINEAVKAAAKNFRGPQAKAAGTFRLVAMDCGRLRAVEPNIFNEAEKKISALTGLAVNRANPGTEIWVKRHNNGAVFFMRRLHKRRPYEKTLHRGELRPDVAHIMLHAASVSPGDKNYVLVDMFGGWGAIAGAAIKNGGFAKIFTGDASRECADHMRKRFAGHPSCEVREWDAARLPLPDASADAAVTDPPWGAHEKIDAQAFYFRFVREAARILKTDGALVFLSSQAEAARSALNFFNFIFETAPIKINGRETVMYCARFDNSKQIDIAVRKI